MGCKGTKTAQMNKFLFSKKIFSYFDLKEKIRNFAGN